jgi:DNA polymerase phi
MNQLSSPARYLHLAAEKSINSLVRRVKSEISMAVLSLKGLMSPPNGEVNFDQVTKTKTVEKLAILISESCLDEFLHLLRGLAINPGVKDDKGAASRRRVIGDLLLNAARSKSMVIGGGKSIPPESEEGIRQILSLLVEFAYFARNDQSSSPCGVDDPPISPASHDMFKSRISSCLTDLTSKSSNPSTFAFHVVGVIHSRQKVGGSSPMLVVDGGVAAVIGKAWKLLERIHLKEQSSSAQKRPFLIAFKLLYSLMILQVYNGDADAVNMLDELKDSYYKLSENKKPSTQGGAEALVEIILTLVAKPALLFRRIGPHVFSACCSNLNEPALESMTQVCKVF